MQVGEGVEHLRDVHLRESLGRGSELVGLYGRREGARLAVLQHYVEVRRGPDGSQLADDVRVVYRTQEVDLEVHPRERRLVDAREGYLLDRHDPSVPLVYGLVHLPVGALAYLIAQYVASHQSAAPRAPAMVRWGRMSASRANSVHARDYGFGKGQSEGRAPWKFHRPSDRRGASLIARAGPRRSHWGAPHCERSDRLELHK